MSWEEEIFDLAHVRDGAVTGSIGEILAWKYLKSKGVFAHKFHSWYPFPATYPLHRGGGDYECQRLNREQADYLKDIDRHGPRRFDLIGFSLKPGVPHYGVYLIEVKTKGLGRGRQDLDYGIKSLERKLPPKEEMDKVKALGFHILLITVRLLDEWRFKVMCKEM